MKGTTAITKTENSAVISNEYFGDSTINAFIASRNGIAPNSQRTYKNALRQLQKFFAANKIATPTEDAVNAFVANLRAEKKSKSTLRLYTAATKLYFAFMERRGICSNVAADVRLNLKKDKTHRKQGLTNEQAKALLAAVTGDSLIARRDRAIVALSLQTGIRTCEVSRANVGNLQEIDGNWYLSVQGKGEVEANVKVRVAPQVVELIQSYLSARGAVADDEPLFASTSNNINWTKNSYGRRLSEQSIGKLIAKYMKAAGVKGKAVTAHSTRHFTAQAALDAGISIREISSMLRHSSIVVTCVYLADIAERDRKAELAVAASLFGVAA